MTAPMYSRYAKEYSEAIKDNVFNAHLERPSMLSLLPELRGKTVLDLGCGPGIYTEYFLSQGADVTAIDISSQMVDMVLEKTGHCIRAYRQDLSHGLPQEQGRSYDLVVCPLTVHYLEDLLPLFRDIRRVLKSGGAFVFSTHHPMVDFESSVSGNYFERELLTEEWDTIGKPVPVSFYRRSLTELFEAISQAGLYVSHFFEGKPAVSMNDISPELYKHLLKNPNFMFLDCRVKTQQSV